MSLTVHSLCSGHISTWLSHVESKQHCTVPFGLDTTMKLLHHSAVSSTPSDYIICCSCNLFQFFFNYSSSAYATPVGIAWYGFMPSLTCEENVTLKYPIPANTLSDLLCISCAIFCTCHHVRFLIWTCNKVFNILINCIIILRINFWICIIELSLFLVFLCAHLSVSHAGQCLFFAVYLGIRSLSQSGIPNNAGLLSGTTEKLHQSLMNLHTTICGVHELL